MRRVVLGSVLVVALALTGCTRERPTPAQPASGGSAAPSSAGDWAAGLKEAEVYTAVLRRYLTSGDNSFSGQTFTPVYVLDRAKPGAADPMGDPAAAGGTPIPVQAQRHIVAALPSVVFIADWWQPVDKSSGCAKVRDGGIVITLGPADGDDTEVKVGINGFVACLGATWLTYVVHNQVGTGWAVTGTTGPTAIS